MTQNQRMDGLNPAPFESDPIRNLGKPIFLMRKKDNGELYAMRRVKRTEHFVLSPTAKDIQHPLLAHLTCMKESSNSIYFYSPFANGGHLFNHLQKARKFDIKKSKLYAAEIICGLQYLHTQGVYGWLKAENVMLDSSGHIKMCGFGLFRQRHNTDQNWKRPEYPAPEVLMNGKYSKAADWWLLGVLLYEILTGLPPFYSDMPEAICNNIISKPLQFPESMDAHTKDILTCLLHRDPEQRLGANGTFELKQHIFFLDVDWLEIIERRSKPSIYPGYVAESFESYGVDYPNISETGQLDEPDTSGIFLGFQAHYHSDSGRTGLRTETGVRGIVTVEESGKAHITMDENLELSTSEKIRVALADALKSDRQDVVAQILEDCESNGDLRTLIMENTPMLAWVVRNGSLETLTFILSESDVKARDRVAATMALNLATRIRNLPAATILLNHGTRCDFDDADRLIPVDLDESNGGSFSVPSDTSEYTPPLVSAVLNGDVDIAQMLLAHGANPNLGYHGVHCGPRGPIVFSCGRIIQLAMELRVVEITQLLLKHGASIELAAPVLEARGHNCASVSRPIYQRVTAALREVTFQHLEHG